ncbi:hypothetical protein B9Z55_003213 [Caenorhabditis nigoni]|uniref:Uncharacterized protein n=1 Tax=Caenorhabditis nigoni TaxID=1611254 RepID=A0A2G5VPH2_9PELO|nr:hypothetical protein B9Z55_003213 [Caenorhabditis nigoni]
MRLFIIATILMSLLVCLQSQPLTASSSSAEDSEDEGYGRCRLTLVSAIIGICGDDCIPDPISKCALMQYRSTVTEKY